MSAEIVNLRKARKLRVRTAKATRGAENRAKFGRSKRERDMAEAVTAQDEARLDGHKLADRPLKDTPPASSGDET